ncbi:MAG: serine/threonine-protein kinase [Planctomycetota bacterium]
MRESMTPERYDRVRALFMATFERDEGERAAYLEGLDLTPEMRTEVQELLDQHDELSTVREPSGTPSTGSTSNGLEQLVPQTGERIGPYVVRRVLGEGAFGTVLEAEQTEPVQRVVALKVLKGGMDTRQVIARFEAERQTLAMMDHRFIAKVFDAGATPAGRPYFVMEFVQGVRITRFCEENGLDMRRRLELFVQVCDAIQHAHHKGVIHRDIKPSNVLVTQQGERAVPKIIDFGIAKATGPRVTDGTTFTERGQLIGTPAYMSPEQAGFGHLDIDTRSDIYSLGALLYEVLVGAPPFDRDRLHRASLVEIQRILREEEPAKASVRYAALAAARGPRSSAVRTMERDLRGDLDWILHKALQKDRTRRYATAADLANDIKRHLADEPVLAGPPSRWYALSKFTRRNRAGLAAAVLVAAASLAGIAAVSWQTRLAREQSYAAAGVIELLGDLFAPPPAGGQRPALNLDKMRGVADQMKNERVFREQPAVRARIFGWLAYVFLTQQRYAEAETNWRLSLALREREFGPSGGETLRTANLLVWAILQQERFREAEVLARRSYERASQGLGDNHMVTLKSGSLLAQAWSGEGRDDEAEALLLDVLPRQQEIAEEHADTLKSMATLAKLEAKRGDLEPAVERMREVIKVNSKTRGHVHPTTLSARRDLVEMLASVDRLAAALAELDAMLTLLGEELPAGHPETQRTRALREKILTTASRELGETRALEATHGTGTSSGGGAQSG